MFDPTIKFKALVNRSHVTVTRRLSVIAGYSEVCDSSGDLYGITVNTVLNVIDPKTDKVISESFYLEKDDALKFIDWFSNSY
jgi:hypothetical protein